ncbi:hypothetical protein P7K49_036976, partial [Saguinus oedipus]
ALPTDPLGRMEGHGPPVHREALPAGPAAPEGPEVLVSDTTAPSPENPMEGVHTGETWL